LLPSTALGSSRGSFYGSGGKITGGKYNRGKQELSPKTFVGTSSGIPAQNTTRRGLGISAWGIVALVVTMILSGMGFYYFSICYPILCKKQRKYDMIGLPTVA
jgi:hypothetical protein